MDRTLISQATLKNWERLGSSPEGRLSARANKSLSQKHIIPTEYLCNKANIPALHKTVTLAQSFGSTERAVFSLCVNKLRQCGVSGKPAAVKLINSSSLEPIDELLNAPLPDDEPDFIGAVYQSLLTEGDKNLRGVYYTPPQVTSAMTEGFSEGLFLDPCCGSGAFLLSANAPDPTRLFGIDTDPLAVMTAKANLICKYPELDFTPNIFCADFLGELPKTLRHLRFGFICSNPPWGAVTDESLIPPSVTSGESFSCFFVRGLPLLESGGSMSFLLPESVISVKSHSDLRRFILNKCRLSSISFFDLHFSGVMTKYAAVTVKALPSSDKVDILKNGRHFTVSTESFRLTDNLSFNPLEDIDLQIILKVQKCCKYDLSESEWALGIVTGDNKRHLFDLPTVGSEPVYTGKEVTPFRILPPKKHIVFDRTFLQQTAPERFYRAEEKLVYRFISDKLVFAYDNSGRLFLNSANILIPHVPEMSVKACMALLNSMLYTFLYRKLFGGIKVLKSSLSALPMPKLDPETNAELTQLADILIGSEDPKASQRINEIIAELFSLTEQEIERMISEKM